MQVLDGMDELLEKQALQIRAQDASQMRAFRWAIMPCPPAPNGAATPRALVATTAGIFCTVLSHWSWIKHTAVRQMLLLPTQLASQPQRCVNERAQRGGRGRGGGGRERVMESSANLARGVWSPCRIRLQQVEAKLVEEREAQALSQDGWASKTVSRGRLTAADMLRDPPLHGADCQGW